MIRKEFFFNYKQFAWSKFRKLRPVLTSRHIPLHICGSVYNTCVRAVMLHGSETWGPNTDELQRLRLNDRAMVVGFAGYGLRLM